MRPSAAKCGFYVLYTDINTAGSAKNLLLLYKTC